jgi:hypothetical protein
MSGTRTFYGNLPASYRRWWLETIYPIKAAQIAGADAGGGGILERLADAADPELERLRRFGACWSWWSVPDDERDRWWSLG